MVEISKKYKLKNTVTFGFVNWIGLWTLYKKEVLRFLIVWIQTLLSPIISSLLFLLVLALAIGNERADVLGYPFITFLAPGLIAMQVIQQAFSHSSSSFMIGKIQGNIVDILYAPLSPGEVTTAVILASATRSFMIGAFSLLVFYFLVDIEIKNYFFKDGVQMVVDGYGLEEITEIMETRIEYREKREKVQTDMLKAMGDLSPAWGMVGTLIGLVLMLAGFGGEGGADNLGGGMAAALITTLYGAVFANLFFLPMADKMGNKTTQTSMSAALLVEAARLIHQKKHPLIVREKLNSFIPPGEWKTEG